MTNLTRGRVRGIAVAATCVVLTTAGLLAQRTTAAAPPGAPPTADGPNIENRKANESLPKLPPPRSSEQPFPPGPVGLDQQAGGVPFPAAMFLGSNEWDGVVGSEYVRVVAGSEGANRSMGKLVLLAFGRDAQPTGTRFYEVPDAGELKIRDVQGTLLHLVAQDGRLLVFDATLRRFV